MRETRGAHARNKGSTHARTQKHHGEFHLNSRARLFVAPYMERFGKREDALFNADDAQAFNRLRHSIRA